MPCESRSIAVVDGEVQVLDADDREVEPSAPLAPKRAQAQENTATPAKTLKTEAPMAAGGAPVGSRWRHA